ncbi:hypothetical protein [Brevibacterium aurantiacum]|uniref:Uncharacterized protein n=1 Tax=Brevibacterium aurantiacum TaxID=273384 RepID=A0A556C4M7_BREAU|nr:hypothetical protein [Brevibacterium aurantiacum]TSI11958.1 hypothetical protein FO013_21175 [Brevibacterium aurantiacum]
MIDQHERLRGHRIRTTLKRVPGILSDLEPTPKRGSGAGSSEPKLPISETVLEAGDVLRSVLVSWARTTMEERHVPPPAEDTIPALVAYLIYHSEWLGRHPAGDEAEDEIADAVANLERLTDNSGTTIFAGHCPECGQAVYAKDGRTAATCTARNEHDESCSTIVDVEAGRLELLTRATDMHASAVDIAAILPVPASTIRQWGRRGHLGGYCDTTTKETRWHIGSVLNRLDQTVTNAA